MLDEFNMIMSVVLSKTSHRPHWERVCDAQSESHVDDNVRAGGGVGLDTASDAAEQ